MRRPDNELPSEQQVGLLRALETRFEKNMNRHEALESAEFQAKLEANRDQLWSRYEMERTGGEPDIVGHDQMMGEYIFAPSFYSSRAFRISIRV